MVELEGKSEGLGNGHVRVYAIHCACEDGEHGLRVAPDAHAVAGIHLIGVLPVG